MDVDKAGLEVTEEALEGSEHWEVLARQREFAKLKTKENNERFQAMEAEFLDAKMWRRQMAERVGSSILGPDSKGEDATPKGSAALKDCLDIAVAGDPPECEKIIDSLE